MDGRTDALGRGVVYQRMGLCRLDRLASGPPLVMLTTR